MKTPLLKIITLLSFLVVAAADGVRSVRADDAPPVPPPPPPPSEALAPEPPPLPTPPRVPDVSRMISNLDRQLQGQISQVGAVVQDVFTRLPGALAGGDGFAWAGVKPGRTFVLPSGNTEGKDKSGETEEDLNVMARILEKTLAAGAETDDRRAMGIAISPFGSPAGAPRNLYLEGYGAVFFLDVSFPLLPPPKKNDEAKAKTPASSEWEEARRELDAARSPEPRVAGGFRNSTRGGGEYDADKVDRLKDDLLESLKNASHIRDLKPDESITVVVTGTSGIRSQRFVGRKGVGVGGGDGWNKRNSVDEVHHDVVRVSGASAETTMTVRIKKSDADAFAAGKLELEEFRKRATLRTYRSSERSRSHWRLAGEWNGSRRQDAGAPSCAERPT